MGNIVEIWNSFYQPLFALLINISWQIAILVMSFAFSIFLIKKMTVPAKYLIWLMMLEFPPLLSYNKLIKIFHNEVSRKVAQDSILSFADCQIRNLGYNPNCNERGEKNAVYYVNYSDAYYLCRRSK